MPRVKIELPDSFLFTTELSVRIDDINYGGHLGHDTVYTLTHEARVRFFNSFGFSEEDIGGVGIVIADSAAVYKSESFYGDRVTVSIATGEYSNHGCDIFYLLENKTKDQEVARVKTGIVFFDYSRRRVARMPEQFRAIITAESDNSSG